jgi:hypothetical protein
MCTGCRGLAWISTCHVLKSLRLEHQLEESSEELPVNINCLNIYNDDSSISNNYKGHGRQRLYMDHQTCDSLQSSDISGICMQGLGLDQQTCEVLKSFGLARQLEEFSQELHVEVNRAVGRLGDDPKVLLRDDQYNHRRCGCHSLVVDLNRGQF